MQLAGVATTVEVVTSTQTINTQDATIGNAFNQLMHVAGPAGLGFAAAAFCLAALGSAWVLYHNLIRTSTRESSYAPYTI